jgi:DNA-binding ferritin-like protein (Dps family)
MTLENINPLDTITDIDPVDKAIPAMTGWYLSTTAEVTEEALPWMLAQGYEVVGANRYGSVVGPITSYNVNRISVRSWKVLQDLLKDFTESYNEGRQANDIRYDDIVNMWSEMLTKSETFMAENRTTLDGQITLQLATLDSLESDYDTFFSQIQTDLNALDLTGDADIERVNNQFNALVAAKKQELMSNGFYSSAMLATIEAGIEEKRALALTEISERLQRMKADLSLKKNQVYFDVLRMRQGTIDAKMGLVNKQQQFLAYQMDERNKILMGLFGFMERRTDSYPDLGVMAQLTASLGDAGGSTWQSA